jgi:hypothetical protein
MAVWELKQILQGIKESIITPFAWKGQETPIEDLGQDGWNSGISQLHVRDITAQANTLSRYQNCTCYFRTVL